MILKIFVSPQRLQIFLTTENIDDNKRTNLITTEDAEDNKGINLLTTENTESTENREKEF